MSERTEKLTAAAFRCFRATAAQLESAEAAFAEGRTELGLSRLREARQIIETSIRKEDWRIN